MRPALDDLTRLWLGARRALLALAVAGTAAGLGLSGWRWAASFLAGVAAGYLNFSSLHHISAAIGAGRTTRETARGAVFLTFRYLLLGAGAYAIVKVFEMNVIAALVGFLAPVAAIAWETAYELIHGT